MLYRKIFSIADDPLNTARYDHKPQLKLIPEHHWERINQSIKFYLKIKDWVIIWQIPHTLKLGLSSCTKGLLSITKYYPEGPSMPEWPG